MNFEPFALPLKRVMPNGVVLYHIPGDGKGSVRLDVLFDGGYSVQSKPLQAMFVNRMLREGCEGLSANEISYRLDYYGAWIDMFSSQNCNHLTLHSLSKHFHPLLELLESMVKSPLFPEENLETVRKNNVIFTFHFFHPPYISQLYFFK